MTFALSIMRCMRVPRTVTISNRPFVVRPNCGIKLADRMLPALPGSMARHKDQTSEGDHLLQRLTNAFPLWVLAASVLALIYPPAFTWFSGGMITWGLGFIMLGMGLTLTLDDFKRIVQYPRPVLLGIALQYTVMPFLGYTLGYLFHLPVPLAVGLVLVSCCPGGTASNVITFLAGADVALSVTMTATSTILAVVMTPMLTAFLAGSRVDVDAMGLFISTVKVVIVPVLAGILMNRFAHKVSLRIQPAAPLVAVVFITLIVGTIIGTGKDKIIEAGTALILSVICLHTFGFLLGYLLARLLIKDKQSARTISIEVGMQNSGLGVVLARSNFTNPYVAIPSAIASVFHSLIGSLLAAFWRKRPAMRWE